MKLWLYDIKKLMLVINFLFYGDINLKYLKSWFLRLNLSYGIFKSIKYVSFNILLIKVSRFKL